MQNNWVIMQFLAAEEENTHQTIQCWPLTQRNQKHNLVSLSSFRKNNTISELIHTHTLLIIQCSAIWWLLLFKASHSAMDLEIFLLLLQHEEIPEGMKP